MDIILFVIGFLFLFSLRPRVSDSKEDYLSRNTTATINGFFLALVFFSHFSTYLPSQQAWSWLSSIWLVKQRQLIVTTFMFFSGYGIMTQLKRRGEKYIDTFPLKRFFVVWFQFIVAITLYIPLATKKGHPINAQIILGSYIGTTSIGNSSWYIFVILVLYILTYIAFKGFGRPNHKVALMVLFVGMILYASVAYRDLPSRYYNTLFCYLAGMIFGDYREQFEQYILKTNTSYWLSALSDVILFCASYILAGRNQGVWSLLWYCIMGISFAFLFVLLPMKLTVRNPIFKYMGGRAMFALYMLQRIPMNLGGQTGLVRHTILFFIIVVITTFVIGWLFDRIVGGILDIIIRHGKTVNLKIANKTLGVTNHNK